MSSQLPRLAKVKAQYHAGSDTHYVLGWFFRDGVQIDAYPEEPDLSVKVEKYSRVSTMKNVSSLQTTHAAFSSVNSGAMVQPSAV